MSGNSHAEGRSGLGSAMARDGTGQSSEPPPRSYFSPGPAGVPQGSPGRGPHQRAAGASCAFPVFWAPGRILLKGRLWPVQWFLFPEAMDTGASRGGRKQGHPGLTLETATKEGLSSCRARRLAASSGEIPEQSSWPLPDPSIKNAGSL